MTLYTAPPPARTFIQDKPTLLVCWWCTCFALVIILFRVAGRYVRTEKLFKEDWIAFACIIPLLIRMAFVHPILLFGTNNVIATGLTDVEIYHRAIGSRLVLVSRILYAATLWMLKLTISEFFKRLIINVWKTSYERMLLFIRWFLLVSFIVVVIADISECQPITHYWQVVPDPGGRCRQGFVQLITMGTANVITDILLVVFPIPIILRSQMGVKRKVQLVTLFSASLIPVGITLYRIPSIISRQGDQPYRSLWASVEILLATGVANATILGSFVRDRGVKKQKFKYGSTTDSMERTATRRPTVIQHWGSDEDLVQGVGLGAQSGLRRPSPQARLAPMATSAPALSKKSGHQNWQFPTKGPSDGDSDESDMKYAEQRRDTGDSEFILPIPKVSFFDVSGLLNNDVEYRARERTDSDIERATPASSPSDISAVSPATSRKGSNTFVQDVGALFSPRVPKKQRGEQGFGMELQSIPHDRTPSQPPDSEQRPTLQSLQDVGGLLK